MTNKQYTLPREFGEKWVKALRETPESKHDIGQYYWPETGCYCAMGIGLRANEIALTPDGIYVKNDEDTQYFGDLLWNEIYNLNDNEGKSFSEIAGWIEQNVQFI